MTKKSGWYAAGALLLAMIARAAVVVYNANLVNTTGLAYSNTYVLNLANAGINSLSAQAIYSTATFLNASFQDGSQASGAFTVLSFAGLKSASAVDSITIVSTTGLAGASISVPGYVFYNGIDWATGNTATNTAVSLKNALATVPYLTVSTAGGIVYATATAGSFYNSYPMVSNNANITVATPFLLGGQDNATVRVNGVNLLQGSSWTASGSNATTATSLASAINNSPYLKGLMTAQAIGSVVTATTTLNGLARNYPIVSSTAAALSASGAVMTAGTNAAFALGGNIFTATNGSALTTALPILYTQGTKALGGLTNQTTYYVVPTTGNSFMLSKYSTSAVAGNTDLVVITSTNSGLAAVESTYTLSPLPWTGSAGLAWTASNDGINWSTVQVSSLTITSNTAAGNTFWSFGVLGAQYIRLSATGPTTGALALKVPLIGTN